ncbi:endonuclease [Sphaerotilus natans subsp. natans DSM 6575]|uniref:Endonuclease n=1 Tax=Sphaerotilus natans subsp. natans DSM 6575 TaxID=1286631 RepID=A0A059KK69_9BURK|nr:DNA/RNA non-specific endonuclease [Sphaerotilus natans]KDB51488.1 endonuclease [Sphaerotilus natans subsp. natans DSM 6575]SIR38001.1 endonuclease G [Sphaerotilus natans]
MLTISDRAAAHAPASVSRLRLRSAALAWMAALVLAGCGGGDDTTQADISTPADTGAEASVERAGPSGHWIIDQDYNGFRLIYDCTDRTALHYRYTLQADTGSAARPSAFTFDTTLPAGCLQQTSTASYESVHPGYDRGHLVMSNHMDSDSALIRRANSMTNIVPQVSGFNRGIWLEAETVAECYRDLAPVQVYGGVVHGDTASDTNDFYLSSHGIRTPEFMWKALITTDPATGAQKAIAWLIPNTTGLGALDRYIVSIAELEQRLGAASVRISASTALKAMKPQTTWALPSGCSVD